MLKITYDHTVDALYIALRDGAVARTVEVDSGTLVDVDEHGDLVGIEVLTPSRAWPIDEVAARFGPLNEPDEAVLRQMWKGNAPYPFSQAEHDSLVPA